MAKDFNSIEKEFESKLAALENEVLLESASARTKAPSHQVVPKVSRVKTLTRRLKRPSSKSKQIPLILRKSSNVDTTRALPPSKVVKHLPGLQFGPILPPSNLQKISPSPVFSSKLSSDAGNTIRLDGKRTDHNGIKYLIPGNNFSSESIRLLIPTNSIRPPSHNLPVVTPPIKSTTTSGAPKLAYSMGMTVDKPVKILVKGTSSMGVVDAKCQSIALAALGESAKPIHTDKASMIKNPFYPTKKNRKTKGAKLASRVPGPRTNTITLSERLLESPQHIIKNHHNSNAVKPSVMIGSSSEFSKFSISNKELELLPKEPVQMPLKLIKDMNEESNKRDVNTEVNQSLSSLQEALESEPHSRKDMLIKLHSIQRNTFDRILSKNFLQNTKDYVDFFKRHFVTLKKLIALRKIIRKYEGSSVPYPIYKNSTYSEKDVVAEEEVQKEIKIFGIEGIACIFHLNDTNHDFLTVMLNAYEHKESNQFFCQACYSKFTMFAQYFRHLLSQHPVILRCIYCGDVFTSAQEFKEHIKSSSHGYCKKCDIIFNDHVSFFAHLRGQHGTHVPIPSVILGEPVNSSDFKNHQKGIYMHLTKYHSNNKCFVCSTSVCKLSFDTIDKLYEHFAANHIAISCKFCLDNEDEAKDFIYCSELEFFAHCKLMGHAFCPICDNLLKDTNLLEAHLATVHSISSDNSSIKFVMDTYPKILNYHRCQPCGYTSINEDEVKRHVSVISQMTLPPDTQSDYLIFQHKNLVCSKCGKIFFDIQGCAAHIATDHGVNLSSSHPMGSIETANKNTNELFINIDKIIEHAKCITDEKSDKVIYTMSRDKFVQKVLKDLQRQSFAKKLRCLTCRVAFPSQEELEAHVNNMHKEYGCDKCCFITKGKKIFDLHKESHHSLETMATASESSQIYTCQICSNKHIFTDMSDLTKHMLKNSSMHSSQICQICIRVFVTADERNYHVKFDHSDKVCHVCDNSDFIQVYPFKSTLLSHFTKHHPELTCSLCPEKKIFDSLNDLEHHNHECHSSHALSSKINDAVEPKAYVCSEQSCINNPIMGSMFVSQANHVSHRHFSGEKPHEDSFLPSVCGLCPEGLTYFAFKKLLIHVEEHHPSIIICYKCVDLPIFATQEDMFLHSKFNRHYSCFFCPLKNVDPKIDWMPFQYHLKENHGILFCWNCEKVCHSLEGHRSICSVCDAVHCLPSININHTCSKEDLDLKLKQSNSDSFLKSRHKSIERYFASDSSSIIMTTKLRLLLQHIFLREFSPSWFGIILEKSERVTVEEAVDILQEATNSPEPDEYLVKLWRDFCSLCQSKFFVPQVKVKMEIDVDPLSIALEQSDLGERETDSVDVFVKEEIQDAMPNSDEEVQKDIKVEEVEQPPGELEDALATLCSKELEVIEPSIPLCLEDILRDEEDEYESKPGPKCSKKKKKQPKTPPPSLNESRNEDDDALLEDIEDILETTQKTPTKKLDKAIQNKILPSRASRRQKRDLSKYEDIKKSQDKQSSLRSRKSDTPKVLASSKRRKQTIPGSERILRKRTKTS